MGQSAAIRFEGLYSRWVAIEGTVFHRTAGGQWRFYQEGCDLVQPEFAMYLDMLCDVVITGCNGCGEDDLVTASVDLDKLEITALNIEDPMLYQYEQGR